LAFEAAQESTVPETELAPGIDPTGDMGDRIWV